ncbi:MAG: hypothetical protein PW792_16700 [Acidobacteriaceae bacterium]|nr:hypothetical protein [Acidobacteriaceae bacterium]
MIAESLVPVFFIALVIGVRLVLRNFNRPSSWEQLAERYNLALIEGDLPPDLTNTALISPFWRVRYALVGQRYGETVVAFEYTTGSYVARTKSRKLAIGVKQRHPGRDHCTTSFWIPVEREQEWALLRVRFIFLRPEPELIESTWNKLRTTSEAEAIAAAPPQDGGILIRPRHEPSEQAK